MSKYTEELFIALQRLLPQHLLSRLAGMLAECKLGPIKNFLIHLFIKHYRINLSELDDTAPESYSTFNDFFTRPLKPDARPIASGEGIMVSPADGFISQIGNLNQGNLIQAKGKHYRVDELISPEIEHDCNFSEGLFATIYLSPRDYHRVHMPASARLISSYYLPGKLFSVNQSTAENIDGLFARNERLVCLFDSENGRFVQVLVGAMLVAGIESTWHGHYKPSVSLFSPTHGQDIMFDKGAEMGRFKFGSTVILLFEKGTVQWNRQLTAGSKIKMGEPIATLC